MNNGELTGESCRSEAAAIGVLLCRAVDEKNLRVDEDTLMMAVNDCFHGHPRLAKAILTRCGRTITIMDSHECACGHDGWLARLN
jgi:hypothetical protein